jgi:hypothetical protein
MVVRAVQGELLSVVTLLSGKLSEKTPSEPFVEDEQDRDRPPSLEQQQEIPCADNREFAEVPSAPSGRNNAPNPALPVVVERYKLRATDLGDEQCRAKRRRAMTGAA